MTTTVDMISHPPHYQGSKWESIEIIEALGNQFRLGNALKYIFRHAKKNGVEDLKKARWYLEREFARDAPSYSDSFDLRFWRAHAREFADSFGLEDVDLINTVAAINGASLHAWGRHEPKWRSSVHEALGHLNAYLLRIDETSEAAA
jgi:hypothetical protein